MPALLHYNVASSRRRRILGHSNHRPYYDSHSFHNRFFRQYRRFGQRTMLGRLFFFGLGMYAGIVANQGYQVPRAPLPSEIVDKVKEIAEKKRSELSPEDKKKIEDILQTLKDTEKKYRKKQDDE